MCFEEHDSMTLRNKMTTSQEQRLKKREAKSRLMSRVVLAGIIRQDCAEVARNEFIINSQEVNMIFSKLISLW